MRKMFTLVAAGVMTTLSANAQGTTKALTVTNGYNADVVVEALPVDEHLTLGVDNGTTGFFVTNLYLPNDRGLEMEMPLTSNNGHPFFIDYAANNALTMKNDNGQSGTLVFAEGVQTSELWVLGISANGGSKLSVVVNYTDGTSASAQEISYGDWWNSNRSNSYEAFSKLDRIHPSNGIPQGVDQVHLDEYKVDCDASKTVTSVTITRVEGGLPSVLGFSTGTAAVKISEGFNEDIVAEKTPVSEAVTTGIDNDGWVLMTKNVGSMTLTDGGMPTDGVVASQYGFNYTIDYAALHAARLGDGSRQLTLTVAGEPQCDALYFLGTAGNGPQTVTAVVNYTDGTASDELSFELPDWFGNGDGATVRGLARFSWGGFDSRCNFNLFEGTVSADASKNIASITLTATGGTPIVMGVGGRTVTTGISNIATEARTAATFNLQGQRVEAAQKGIYIVNGKKYIAR